MQNSSLAIRSVLNRMSDVRPLRVYGRIDKIVGLTVESEGPPCSVGDVLVRDGAGPPLMLQVVGFRGRRVVAMPLGDLEGIQNGDRIFSTGQSLQVPVGPGLRGRVINALGTAIDGGPQLVADDLIKVGRLPRNAMGRQPIDQALETGVRAIDGLITLGLGQRVGIFSGSGVGKSTLMGMIARNTTAELNVIALIGERGRELKDFITKSLGPEGLSRSIIVAATSDEPALLKIQAAFAATAIAEYFSDKGVQVLLMMDSLTRLAMAQREVGLSAGEPPSSKGYTPSVFAMMPKLLERAGRFESGGSLTGIYTVLVEGDDLSEPISDHARSILDGHIVLSREMAHRNHFPSIDVLGSISRLMTDVADATHQSDAGRFRDLLAAYRQAEDLINIGAYRKGNNPRIDAAMERIEKMNVFLKQGRNVKSTFAATLAQLKEIFS
jgi:flagellum-specific ATP synthase